MIADCPNCSRFCFEQTFKKGEEWLSWMERVGDSFEEVYCDQPKGTEGIVATVKCRVCGQLFMTTANLCKSNLIAVAATWKPIPRPPA